MISHELREQTGCLQALNLKPIIRYPTETARGYEKNQILL